MLNKQRKEPSSFQNRNQIIPFYGMTNQYGNLPSESAGEENKTGSMFFDGDWFKPMEDIKKKIFPTSKSSGIDSPSSFMDRSMRNFHPNNSASSSVMSYPRRPEIDQFKPLRNPHDYNQGEMSAKIIAASSIFSDKKKEPRLMISNPRIKIESVRESLNL